MGPSDVDGDAMDSVAVFIRDHGFHPSCADAFVLPSSRCIVLDDYCSHVNRIIMHLKKSEIQNPEKLKKLGNFTTFEEEEME